MLTGWQKTVSKCFIIPQRYVLSIMGFLAIVNAYTMRICLNIAITEMVKKPNTTNSELDFCPDPELDDSSHGHRESIGSYEWSGGLQGWILSAFFYGYVLTHIPGGILSDKFGGKYTLGLGILSTAIFTLLTPVVTIWGGAPALIALRFLEGLGEGTTFPALSSLLSSWIPVRERSRLGSFVFGGGQIGTILGTLLSGYLIDYFNSWESVFYFFGILGLCWFVVFVLICYKDPESHPFIKDSEKEYLQREMGALGRRKDLPSAPWLTIFKSVPMQALVCAQIGHDFGFYIMATDLPIYMSTVLKFPIKENGLYSSIPYLAMWVSSILMGIVSDWMFVRKMITITNTRKLWTTVGSFFPAFLIVAASYAGCDRTTVIILFSLAMGTMGGFYPGMKCNPLDLSPNYSATIMATTNGIGAITGFIVPILVGYLAVDRGGTVSDWRLVFWIAFGIFHVTNIVYVIWASGDIQPWNDGITGVTTLRKSKNLRENGSISEDSENSLDYTEKGKSDEKLEKIR